VNRPPVATPPLGVRLQPPATAVPAEVQIARSDVLAACRRARVDGQLRERIADELIAGLQAIASRPEATDRDQLERALLGLIGGIVKNMVSSGEATSSTINLTPPTGAQRLDPSQREGALRLLRELETMPDDLRRPVTLHYLAGIGHRGVGKILGVDQQEARLRIHHGAMALRQRLGEDKRLIDLLPQLIHLRDASGAQKII
jgi:hypothetical protein